MTTHAATIEKLETRFWQSMVDKDPETAMTMIADQSLIAGPAGVMKITPKKYGEMTREGDWTLKSFEFDDLEVVFPSDDVAVIAYKVRQKGDMKGEKMDLRCADTSTWVKQDGEWKCSAHTETILDHMPLTN
jgi:ketosteroid isomerase-like protein